MGQGSRRPTIVHTSTMTADGWRDLARRAVAIAGTPCFVMSASLVRAALDELTSTECPLPRRHWLSFKTQPLRPLIELWRDWGLGIEVVSPFELHAAVASGLTPDRILVNGTAKQRWLAGTSLERLNVHFDSSTEVHALIETARAHHWRIGLRCQVHGLEYPHDRDQFGMTPGEIVEAIAHLRAGGLTPRGVHFHIGSNVRTVQDFAAAVQQVRRTCDLARFEPEYLDVGGGLPAPGERAIDGAACDAPFDLSGWTTWMSSLRTAFPALQEVWLENGRFMTARSGALIVSVIDRKDRDETVYIICDGGRTNHARLSAVEVHDVVVDPDRGGRTRSMTVCGPTCGAVDRLGRFDLPDAVRIGDRLLWMNAGAYALPLETRFSFGLAPVIWCDEAGDLSLARPRETAEQWWGLWR
jgi:diaminopimelate decarboxylase